MVGDPLPADWKWATLEEVQDPRGRSIVSGPFGSNIGSRFFVESGVPVIRGSNLTTDLKRFVERGFVYLTEDKAREFKNCEAVRGDLVFTAAGSLGQVGIIPSDSIHDRYIISNKQLRARVDTTKVLPLYAFYWFSSPEMVAYIQQRNTGSTIPLINLSVLRQLPIPIPSLSKQESIVAILSSLDDKIELNLKTNETLDAMARAIFKSWFIDFDPVHAKSKGQKPEGMDAETAKLFPSSFQDSEMGPIPKGWKVLRFENFIDRKSVGKKYDNKTILPVGSVPVLDQGKTGVIGFHNNEPGVKASLDEPIVVFANHTCYMRLITYSFSAIQNVLPFVGAGVDTFWAFYATEGRVSFSEYKGHWPDFVIQEAVVPPLELTIAFGQFVKVFMASTKINTEESQSLTTIRDALLPRLLSGEITVPEEVSQSEGMGRDGV